MSPSKGPRRGSGKKSPKLKSSDAALFNLSVAAEHSNMFLKHQEKAALLHSLLTGQIPYVVFNVKEAESKKQETLKEALRHLDLSRYYLHRAAKHAKGLMIERRNVREFQTLYPLIRYTLLHEIAPQRRTLRALIDQQKRQRPRPPD